MKTESLGGFDRFRVPAALLVIAIHTGPLLSLNGEANYLLTDILARIAVPFFFSVSGWFLVPRLLREGRAALIPFVKKLLLLYGAAVLLYLPLNLYNHTLEESGFALLRDVLFNGTFYHLWYFPALVLGACLVYGLLRILGPRWAWLPALLLYAAGLLGDSYFGLTAALPPLRAGYEALFLLFDYTRNGLFFPPVFLLLGGWLALRPARRSAAWYGAGLLLSLALLTAEGLLVQRLALARFDALYLSLPLCVGFLLRWLQRLSLPSAPALRDWAAAVYVLHPWCIVLIRGGAGVVGLTGLLVDNCLVHYLAVVLLSSLLALPFARIRPAPSPRSRAWIELDAAALRHNLAALGSLLPAGASLMPVIKANAYGHGDLEIARLCVGAGADAFAVATAAEGVRLRRGGVRGTILVLGYSGPELAPLLARYRLTQTVVSTEHARALDACGRRLAVHLKVDTGLHRLGIPWDDTQSLTAPYSCSHLRVTGVFTHLADTERLDEASQAVPGSNSGAFGQRWMACAPPDTPPEPSTSRAATACSTTPASPAAAPAPASPCTASSAPPATPPRRSSPSARCSPCGPGYPSFTPWPPERRRATTGPTPPIGPLCWPPCPSATPTAGPVPSPTGRAGCSSTAERPP